MRPAVNAEAAWGSQQAALFPGLLWGERPRGEAFIIH
jgi:hypothetical protein